MMPMSDLDRNMRDSQAEAGQKVIWYDVRREPFQLYGLYQPQTEPGFHRLPEQVAAAASEAVARLERASAGGRVRFSTDSPFVAIRAAFREVSRMPHMPLVASAGFDLYEDGPFGSRYIREFRMPYDMENSYQQVISLPAAGMRCFTLHFPLYSAVEQLEIGLAPGAALGEGAAYRPLPPVVVYGSSIVQGAAASHPGQAYPAQLSRMLNIDHINLGFSGNARAELPLAEHIAALPMSALIYDYDHNAPTVDFLRQTHAPFYRLVRERRPELPIVMVTRPNYYTAGEKQREVLARRDVILQSYLDARAAGDEGVYLIDGMSFFAQEDPYACTADHIHPNDRGFACMAKSFATVLRHILEGGAA